MRFCWVGSEVLQILLRSGKLQNNAIFGLKRKLSFNTFSTRRKFAEITVNKFKKERVMCLGPDLACLEWLMNCGSTLVKMSDGTKITSQSQMKLYIESVGGYNTQNLIEAPKADVVQRFDSKKLFQSSIKSDIMFAERWPFVAPCFIEEVDASDAAISDEGFRYFSECRQIKTLKMNFCDYFSDSALHQLAMGRPSRTLLELEIVMNPHMTDSALNWLSRMRSLRRAHFYFLPYVTQRSAMLRQLRSALPHCRVTFPETNVIGCGYEEMNKE